MWVQAGSQLSHSPAEKGTVECEPAMCGHHKEGQQHAGLYWGDWRQQKKRKLLPSLYIIVNNIVNIELLVKPCMKK